MKCYSTILSPSETPEVHSWETSFELGVHSADLTMPVEVYATGWNHAMHRKADFRVRSMRPSRGPKPNVVSLPLAGRPVTARSFYFAPPPISNEALPETADDVATVSEPGLCTVSADSTDASPSEAKHSPEEMTRIRIPPDAIKLEDRLHYLLQPALESLLARRSFELPFEPFPYQYEGVGFLYSSHKAILADEMGLGKTMQAIVTTRLLLRSGEIRGVLLVCPKPLVTNWKREFELWAPELGVQVIEGSQERRKWLWQLDDVPVRIANYELLHRDRDFYDRPPSAGGTFFDLVILDESQRIKNQSSATSKAARAIPHKRSWALTGTPVENSPEDLVGIFEFLSPGFLATHMKPSQMSKLVGEYILRRTKDKVLTDLPPKMIRDAEIELSVEQQETYDLAEDEGVLRLSDMGEGATIQHVFELVLRLKQICNFDPATGASAKLERLKADLEEVAESGRKAIVFSQWVGTLERLKTELADFHPVEYHGKVPSSQRDGVIERFRDDPDCHVILMSYGAGSVGLNLQFAGYVFLFDRWWNPAIEDQAINRAHRIGANGPVTVTRFLSLGTIEQRIDRVLQEKRELFETILSGAKGSSSTGMNQKEIFGLFNLSVPQTRKSA
jgi:SNF2 family DNA or RNA helicase